jgi:type IV pilus assembly protein PilC
MPLYRYTVEDKTGRTLNGVMQANDESDLAQRLNSLGYTLRVAVVGGSAPVASGPMASSATNLPTASGVGVVPPSLEPRIPLRSLATYLRQMASLIRSGLAPYQATGEILSRTQNARLRKALEGMQAQTLSGGSLSPVMTAHPDIFPTKVVGLIYCGELGGYLDIALDEAATDIEMEVKARYVPKLFAGFVRLNLIGLFLGLPFVRLDIIFPRLAQLAKPTDQIPQDIRNAMQAMAEVCLKGAFAAISATLLFLAATYGWPHLKRIPAVRAWIDGFILKMPVWGPLQMSRSLSQFGKSLGRLYAAGIAPGPAWLAASATCGNTIIANRIRAAGSALNSGAAFSTAVEQAGVFDHDIQALLIAGERSGDIPGMLQKVTQFEDERALAQHKKGRWLSTSLVTSCLIAMGGLIVILITWAYFQGVFKGVDAMFGGS